MSGTSSPPAKHVKLESDSESEDEDDEGAVSNELDEELDGDHCSICLQLFVDKAVIPDCSHEFCFDCILVWTDQSRRCPLCTRTIGPYLIHHIRSNYDYQKYHLPPLRSSPPPIQPLRRMSRLSEAQRSSRGRQWGRRERRERDVADELERAVDKRRWVYHNHLYAKHVASNTFTRYRPVPTPSQFSASQDYISRATIFVRRELRVWVNLDVEFLTTFILSLMKAIDIRSESAVKLLAEFLDMDVSYAEGRRFPNAEHFAHEVYSYLRSPFKSLTLYDANVQYDAPKDDYGYQCADRDVAIDPERPVQRRDDGLAPYQLQASRPDFDLDFDCSPQAGSGPPGSKLINDGTCSTHMKLSDGKKDSECPSNLSTLPKESSELPVPPRTVITSSPPSHTTASAPLSASRAQASSQDRKGKQRAPVATQVTHSHGHAYTSALSASSELRALHRRGDDQEAGNIQSEEVGMYGPSKIAKTISRTSHDITPKPMHSDPSSRKSVETKQIPARNRNPLLIARAHLTKATMAGGHSSKPPKAVATETSSTNSRTDLRENFQHCGAEGPSLLSRITDPQAPDAHAGNQLTVTGGVPESHPFSNPSCDSVDIPKSRENGSAIVHGTGSLERANNLEFRSSNSVTIPEAKSDLHARLLQRLDAERAHIRLLSSSENIKSRRDYAARKAINDAARSMDDDRGVSKPELEAKLRARARLRMKLAVEKHFRGPAPKVRGTSERVKEIVSNGQDDSVGLDDLGGTDHRGSENMHAQINFGEETEKMIY